MAEQQIDLNGMTTEAERLEHEGKTAMYVAIDGKTIRSVDDLFRLLDSHEIGDTLTLTVVRNERKMDVQIVLQALP